MSDEGPASDRLEQTLLCAVAAAERQTRVISRSLRVIEKLIDACVDSGAPIGAALADSPKVKGFSCDEPLDADGGDDEEPGE